MASTGIFVVCCSIGSLLSAGPRISLTFILGHVPCDENNHHQIYGRVEDEYGSQANSRDGSCKKRAYCRAEHADARQQPEAAATAVFRNSTMRGAEGQRKCTAGKQSQADAKRGELFRGPDEDHGKQDQNAEYQAA